MRLSLKNCCVLESTERCDVLNLMREGLMAPDWASAKAICIATHFGTTPSLGEQNHRELPSIPIIIKANISQCNARRPTLWNL